LRGLVFGKKGDLNVKATGLNGGQADRGAVQTDNLVPNG